VAACADVAAKDSVVASAVASTVADNKMRFSMAVTFHLPSTAM
jgi:hypothetical protein